MNRRDFVWGLAGVSALPLRGQVSIQPRPKPPAELEARNEANIRVDSRMVLVPVSVVDNSNHPVTGLEKEHFRVLEEKVEQDIATLSMDDQPVAVGLIFDTSGSMGEKMKMSRLAAAQFFQTGNPDDEYFLVEFNDQPKLSVQLTRSYEDIQTRLTFSNPKGRTSLLDAIMLGMHQVRSSSKERKVLLIISDGGDNASRYTDSEVRKVVKESDVLLYAIGVYEAAGARGRTPEEAAGPGLLTELTEQSGGRHYPAALSELPDIAAKIGVELRNRYVLGYYPKDRTRDGRYRHIEVKLVPPKGLPKLTARWRQGYFAPSS